jgi:hypothetical protein
VKHLARTLLTRTLCLFCLLMLSSCQRSRQERLDLPEPTALLKVETEQAACGTGEPGRIGGLTTLKARPDVSGKLRVWVGGYDYYCSPRPSFVAHVDAVGRLVIEEAPLPPDATVSRCTCPQNVVFTIQGVAAGSHEIVLLQRGNKKSAAPLAEANVTIP